MDLQAIMGLTVEGLKGKLTELELVTTGRKGELQQRLVEHFGLTADHSDSEYDDVASAGGIGTVASAGGMTTVNFERSMFTLRDIEDSLTPFCGTDNVNVGNWLEEFENNAEAVGWSQLQRFIYAKQLLKGAARIFIRSQNGIGNFNLLKNALIGEFGSKLASIDIHKQLEKRRKRNNESLREYLYTLMEIGKPIKLEEESLIQYFIEGIPDSKFGKSILYQARDVDDLKEKLKTYEKIRGSVYEASTSKRTSEPSKVENGKPISSGRRKCYKCGQENHLAKDCKSSTFKCFKCGKAGHKSFECKDQVQPSVKVETNNTCMIKSFDVFTEQMGTATNRNFKSIEINGVKFSAIIDSGSDISLIRLDVFECLGDVRITMEDGNFITAGDYTLRTIGYFDRTVSIDGNEYDIKFFVARNFVYPAAIGNDIFRQATVIMSGEGAKFQRKDGGKESGFRAQRESLDEFDRFCSAVAVEELNEGCDLSHLQKERALEVKNLIGTYGPGGQKLSPISMKIILSDEIPIYQRPRRLSYDDQRFVERQVEEWLRDGIIRPSTSEYASPVVVVPKKSGDRRLCCDFRKLNEKIMRDNFPMVLIDDVLHRLQSAKIYTTLDLKNGFFHVPVDEESRKYTSFVTHNGQYEFMYVPFGICNSPAVFSRFVFSIYRDLIQDGTIVIYIDDIIIPSLNEEEGMEKLEKVLKIAESYNLRIKWEKCQLLRRRVNFLGYIVENSTIRPSIEKTAAVANFPVPKDRKALQRFLGLTSYFRRFISSFATIAKPLSDLLKKDVQFVFKDTQMITFEQLKCSLMNAPVLRLYNPKSETEVHTDASMFGYGGVLLQKDDEDQQFHPVEFMSRKTTAAQEKYHSYELEVLAIIEALRKWRIYLIGSKVKIVTDCNAFAMTMKKKDVPLRVSRWAMFMQEFDYTIEHRSGSKMKHVDALSRVSCLLVKDSVKHRLKDAQLQDEWVKAVRKIVEKEEYGDFYLRFDLLYKDPNLELIVIPAAMEEEIIKIAHREGHFGAKKTKDLVEREFYIPNIASKVNNVVRSCMECIVSEAKTGKKEGLLNPIDKSDKPLRTYHIDHVGPMELTKKRYNHILVVVDAFSKFVWLYPTRSTGSEEVVERLKRQSTIFGNPERIISDRGTAFTSNLFEEYCERNQIQHLLIATGVPRGNGQVERMNRIVISLLSKLCVKDPQQWYKNVDRVQQCINNTTPRSTKYSPFRILTGLDMRIKDHEDIRKLIEDNVVQELSEEREEIRGIAKENIAKIQAENRRNFNRNRVDAPVYELNDLVAIKRTLFGSGLKLKPKYFGPYKIVKRLNHDRYEVEKVGDGEGPAKANTVAEYMKRWNTSFGSNDHAGRPNVGTGSNGRTTRSGNAY